MLDEIFYYISLYIKPKDIIAYSRTNTKNNFYSRDQIVWKNLFMRDYYYEGINLKLDYLSIYYVKKYTVKYIKGPMNGWLNQYKYCYYRDKTYRLNR